jgi:hypothetical protein
MSPRARSAWLFPLLASVLVAAFLAQAILASRVNSPTWDETGHLAAGLAYVEKGVFTVNMQHPPLLKVFCGLSLSLAGIHYPSSPRATALLGGADELQWSVGGKIIAGNGPGRVMFWARLPFILVGALLGVFVWLWARLLAGEWPALGALLLAAFDPNLVAHSALVTTDAGCAAFTVAFFYALWRYVRRPDRLRLMWCGLALGAALAAKFSALFLLPVAAFLLLASVFWPAAGPAESSASAKAGPNDACPCGSGRKFKKCHGAAGRPLPTPAARRGHALVGVAAAFCVMLLIAALVIEAAYFFSSPSLYATGASRVNADHDATYLVYLAGFMESRYTGYFAAVYLLKEPLAGIALAIFGLVLIWRSRSLTRLDKLFLLVPPLVLFVAYSVLAANVGIRYILPVLPFAYLAGGMALAALHRALAAVLCVWLIIAAIGIFPDHLSYFNESACLAGHPSKIGLDGGSACGVYWLDDHNVDWGQGLVRLKAWLDRHGQGRPVRLAYFGSFPPAAYGLPVRLIDDAELLEPPPPGLTVVSAHMVARLGLSRKAAALGVGEWLRRTPPTAILGHCLYVYDIPR